MVPDHTDTTSRSIDCGWYCGCLSSSTRRTPRSSCAFDAASRSEPKAANASSSRNWARFRRRLPATLRIALGCAEPPTRDTEMPTLMAGRTPELNRSDSRKHLSVGDGDDVGRDVRRHVVGLGLDDRQPRHRARAEVVGQLRAALEQAAVQVEDVTGVRLAARRAAQQERHGAVGLGLLRQVVEHDEDVLALVHPVLADGRAGVGRQVLEAGGVGRRGGDDGGVLHRAVLLEGALHRGDGRALLADGDVDAADLLLRVAGLPVLALVEDRVEADGGLAGLAVADDQLTLAAPDGGHRVDGLDAGLHRLLDGLALDDRRRLHLEGTAPLGDDRAEAVDRVAQGVDHAAHEAVADRDREHLAGAADRLALLDLGAVAEQHDADLAHVEVEGHAEQAALELQQLVRHGRVEALDARDAVAGLHDAADLFAGGARRVRRDVPLDRIPDLFRPDRQLRHGVLLSFSARGAGACRMVRCVGVLVSPAGPGERLSMREATVPSMTSSPMRDVDAAQDGRIDGHVEPHRAALQPGQGVGEPALLGGVQGCGHPDLGDDALALLRGEAAELVDDGVDAAAVQVAHRVLEHLPRRSGGATAKEVGARSRPSSPTTGPGP